MHIHLETIIIHKDGTRRYTFYKGTLKENELSNLPPEYFQEFPNGESIRCWYVASLEDHEREELESKESQS